MIWNVVPENDEREHLRETWCWCDPTVRHWTKDGVLSDMTILHNSEDCREVSERVTNECVAHDKRWIIYERADC